MSDHQRIPVRPDAYEAAKEAKRDDETWSEYVLRCADADVPRKWTRDEIESMIDEYARQGGRR